MDIQQPTTPAESRKAPIVVGSGDLLGDTSTHDALALVDVGPLKTAEWMERSVPMCKWCEKGEDVDQAAARILAKEVRRLREVMEKIINQQPCCEGGSCFFPMHDGEGNYIGEMNVDPLSVIQTMAALAQDALSPNVES